MPAFYVWEDLHAKKARGWSSDALFKDRRAAALYASALVQDHLAHGATLSGFFPNTTKLEAVVAARGYLTEPYATSLVPLRGAMSLDHWICLDTMPGQFLAEDTPSKTNPLSAWPDTWYAYWETKKARATRGYSGAALFKSKAGRRRWAASCVQYWRERGARVASYDYHDPDFLLPVDQDRLQEFLRRFKEIVFLYGPPCETGFGPCFGALAVGDWPRTGSASEALESGLLL